MDLEGYADYSRELCEDLYRFFEVKHHSPTVFRNRKVSCHRGAGTELSPHQIIFGWRSVEQAATHGFREYKRIEWLWHGGARNLEAVHRLVLHEFAHVLAEEAGGRTRGSVHNGCFVRKLRDLQEYFPFN